MRRTPSPREACTTTDLLQLVARIFSRPLFGHLLSGHLFFYGLLVAGLFHGEVAHALDLEPREVAPDVYYVQGQAALGSSANQNFISNAGFVITRDSVVVIDALGSPALAQSLIECIRRLTPKPISHVLVTHYHADHIYGLQTFKAAGARIVAHRTALEYLNSDTARLRLEASRTDIFPWIDENTRLVHADRWIDTATSLNIGGFTFKMTPAGPAHTLEDLVIEVVERHTAFTGDLVFAGRIPFVGGADSRSWLKALQGLAASSPRVIVPGHGPHSAEPQAAIQFTAGYLGYLRKVMGVAARELEPFEDAYRSADWSAYRDLPLFEAANRMNAYNTYLLMETER